MADSLPWLIFPPAVDLANTVIDSPTGERDLLETPEQLAAWIAAERGRIPGVEDASSRLEQVRELRNTVRTLLQARARGKLPPAGPRRRMNTISEGAPSWPALGSDGAVTDADGSAGYARFEVVVARSAIEMSSRDEKRLRVCEAPSCGMLYLQEHPRQVWCSNECGNRARVARHAARRRSSKR